MPRHSHRRRHRSADRDSRWIRRVTLTVVTLLGLAALVAFCLMTPAGRIALTVMAAIAALFAIGTMSYFLGRAAAAARNACALHAGRTNLERLMRSQEEQRQARSFPPQRLA